MTTVRPPQRRQNPEHFTDTRTVVIVLVALLLSLGAALSAGAVAASAGYSPGLTMVVALSTGGSATFLMIAVLDRLIGK